MINHESVRPAVTAQVLELLLPFVACCLISACALKMNLVNLVPGTDEPVAALPNEYVQGVRAGISPEILL